MATLPAGLASSDDDACVRHSALDKEPSRQNEYTRILRHVWPLLLRGVDVQELNPRSLKSWVCLWGCLGAALFNCFWRGDQFVRADMIVRARQQGGLRGKMVAHQLEQCAIYVSRD